MTKYTNSSKIRHFDPQKTGIVRREKPVASMPTSEKPCGHCKRPMKVSYGQNATYHKECRKLARKTIRGRKLIYTV